MEDIRSFVVHNNYLTYFVINEESLYVLFCFFESSSHCYLLHGFEFVSINLSFFFVTYKHVIQLGEESCLSLDLVLPSNTRTCLWIQIIHHWWCYPKINCCWLCISIYKCLTFSGWYVWLLVVDMFDFLNIFVSHILPPITKMACCHISYILRNFQVY